MRIKHSWTLLLGAALLATVAGVAAAQETTRPSLLLTQRGWELGGQLARYHYEEPGVMKLTGERTGFVGAYTFTNPKRVYTRIDLRVSYGLLEYESVGTGSMDDVPDWIGEARAVVGRDYLVGGNTALSPYIGLGYRYLYNDLRGYSTVGGITYVGYRRYSRYIYIPLGLTARFRTGERWVVAPTIEYDAFLGGRQETKQTDTGIPGRVDFSNRQEEGRGYRVYLMVESRRWSFGPWLHYWKIRESDVVFAGFNNLGQPLGGFEPANWTREYGLELRYRF